MSAAQSAGARPDLSRLLSPLSVAIVGARPERGSIGGGVLANLELFGFPGDIHLVSRSLPDIRGRACVKSISELPLGIDVVVLVVPREHVRENVLSCVERKVGALVVFTSGFAEAGEEGRRAQEEIAEIARAAGIPMLGPNCMGFTNLVDNIPIWFGSLDIQPLKHAPAVAIVAQSGAMAANIRMAIQAREIPVSFVVTTGNEAQLYADDFIDFLVDHEGTSAIGIYVEQIRDPQKFLIAARRASRAGKPIVLLHPGSSERGRDAAQSHSGALAGDHAVMRAAVGAEGVAVVDTADELFDALAILVRYPRFPAGGVGIIANSGAMRGLSLDFCDSIGLELPTLSEPVAAEISARLPDYMDADNPLDLGTSGFSTPSLFGEAAGIMLKDAHISGVLLAYVGGTPAMQVTRFEGIRAAAAGSDKPVLIALLGDEYPLDPGFVAAARQSGIPFFRSPYRALRALKTVLAYAKSLESPAAGQAAEPAPMTLPGRGVLAEYDGKAVLGRIGIVVPQGALARSVEEALAIAERIGFPVVAKAQASALAHKSDVGGVVVGIKDGAALRTAWQKLHDNVAAARPGLALDGVLIEQMADGGLEMVVGARRDPQWGPVLVVGLGGVWIEALKDVCLLPAHASKAQIIAAIGSLKGATLLGPFRGQPARDVDALADAIVTLGRLMLSCPDLMEVDVNPLVVRDEGQGVIALDALLVASE